MLALHGVDVYLRPDTTPDPPDQHGAMSLSFISDRGTRIKDRKAHDSSNTEIYCARYESDSPVDDKAVEELLKDFAGQGLSWPKAQKLYRFENGDAAYSQPY
jgi:hypothetical protein